MLVCCKEICQEIDAFMRERRLDRLFLEEYLSCKKIKKTSEKLTVQKAIHQSKLLHVEYVQGKNQLKTVIVRNM